DPIVGRALVARLSDQEDYVVAELVDALSRFPMSEVGDGLIATLGHAENWVRKKALEQLLQRTVGDSTRPTSTTSDPDLQVREAWLQWWAREKEDPVWKDQVFRDRLFSTDAATRFEAVDDLLRRKEPAAITTLIKCATDQDSFLRRLVIEGLRDYPGDETTTALLLALTDEDAEVAEAAWVSLRVVTEVAASGIEFHAEGTEEERMKTTTQLIQWIRSRRSAPVGK
ncbi:MAG: HEAT repeat domain-containing protein, partial [Planctomycetota bacterium]